MNYKSIINFPLKTSIGINIVPNGSVVIVKDYDGITKSFLKLNNTGLTGSSTLADAFTSGALIYTSSTPITIDATPTDASANAVSSNGVFDGLATKVNTTGSTMTGALTSLRETKIAMGANDINLASGNLFTKTISGATTLTMSNKPASGQAISFILELTNAGSAVITWFSGVKWAGGTAPTLTTAGVDIIGFYSHDGGNIWRGLVLAKDSK